MHDSDSKAGRIISQFDAVNEAIAEEMRIDNQVFIMGFEVSSGRGLVQEFGVKRVLDTPISELGVLGLGVGASRRGAKPIIDLMSSSFFILALDQLAHHAAITRHQFNGVLPSSLVLMGMTGIGKTVGATQHSRMLHLLLMGIPGRNVVYPSDSADAKGPIILPR